MAAITTAREVVALYVQLQILVGFEFFLFKMVAHRTYTFLCMECWCATVVHVAQRDLTLVHTCSVEKLDQVFSGSLCGTWKTQCNSLT